MLVWEKSMVVQSAMQCMEIERLLELEAYSYVWRSLRLHNRQKEFVRTKAVNSRSSYALLPNVNGLSNIRSIRSNVLIRWASQKGDLTILSCFPKQDSLHGSHYECGHAQRPINPGYIEGPATCQKQTLSAIQIKEDHQCLGCCHTTQNSHSIIQ